MTKLKPTSITVSLGTIEASQARRASYSKAAEEAGMKLSTWARYILDKASAFASEIKDHDSTLVP